MNAYMKNSFFYYLKLFTAFLMVGSCYADSNFKKVCISQIIEHPALNRTCQGILDELEAQGYVRSKNLICRIESAQGKLALATQIAQKFVGEHPDVIVAIGTVAAQPFVKLNRLNEHPIPVVFSSVTDPIKSGLIVDLVNPIHNITGVSNFLRLEPHFALFKAILKKQSVPLKLGILYNPGEANSVAMIEYMKGLQEPCGIQLLLQPVTNAVEVGTATTKLIDAVDAIFINNDNTALAAFSSIAKIALKHKIPVFTSDVDLVEQGALAALGPDQYELGRQTGQMLVTLLRGEKTVEQLPIEFPQKNDLYLNVKIAKLLGLEIEEGFAQQATKILY
jgi:putative ABC transport system substrate-binding protein